MKKLFFLCNMLILSPCLAAKKMPAQPVNSSPDYLNPIVVPEKSGWSLSSWTNIALRYDKPLSTVPKYGLALLQLTHDEVKKTGPDFVSVVGYNMKDNTIKLRIKKSIEPFTRFALSIYRFDGSKEGHDKLQKDMVLFEIV